MRMCGARWSFGLCILLLGHFQQLFACKILRMLKSARQFIVVFIVCEVNAITAVEYLHVALTLKCLDYLLALAVALGYYEFFGFRQGDCSRASPLGMDTNLPS